jgi:chemotaxis response regulator CheB
MRAGGDAVVAFQEPPPQQRASLDGGEPGLIKAQHHGKHGDPAAVARDLLGRRALVAAAALSGRTVSGLSQLSDVLADASDAASDDVEAAEQQEQQEGSRLSQHGTPASPPQPLPPSAQQPGSSVGTGAGGPASLTRLARQHAADAHGSDDIV